METLRTVKNYTLNKGDGMARGLYNIADETLMEINDPNCVSIWFDEETKDEFLKFNESKFIQESIKILEL